MITIKEGWSYWQKMVALSSALLLGLFLLLALPAVSAAGEAELQTEIDKLWNKLASIEGTSPEGLQEEQNWTDRVTFSGVVEIEAGVYDGDDETTTNSDIAVATVELGVDAEISAFSSAHVLLLYEDGADGVAVDEAFITIGNPEKNPLSLTAGKMYVPYGNYESQMISDPLTLEIGETSEDVLQVAIETGGFYSSAYAFNGDADVDGDDEIEHYGANAGFAFGTETVSIDGGVGWISSIQDSDGLTDALPVTEYIAGYAAHLIAASGPVTLIGEYIGADDDLMGAGTDSQISAYNLEIGVSFPLAGRDANFAVGFQSTDESGGLLVEERIVATLAIGILDGTTLALEWLTEEDYDVANGGTGTDWDIYTLQLAAEF